MAEPPKPLNIDDSTKPDETSSSPSFPRITLDPILQAYISNDLKYWKQIIPRHLIESDYEKQPSKPGIIELPESLNIDSSKSEKESSLQHSIYRKPRRPTTLEIPQASTSGTWHVKYSYRQPIISRHHIKSTYKKSQYFLRKQPSNLDAIVEPFESLNIDDVSESNQESSPSSKSLIIWNPQQACALSRQQLIYLQAIIWSHIFFSDKGRQSFNPGIIAKQHKIMARLNELLNIDYSESDEEPSQHTHTSSSSTSVPQTRQKKAFSEFIIKHKYLIIFKIFLIFLFLIIWHLRLQFLHKYQNNMRKCVLFATELVLDQDTTIQVLTEYLQQDLPLLKIVALIGDTGVDKSYTVDIIKKKFRRRSDNDFSSLYPNFVVLENLRAEHSTDIINYVKSFHKAYGNRQINILAVFKIEQIDDASMHNLKLNRIINIVKDTFIEANINIKIIRYKPLNEKALEKYIINTAKNIRLTLSQDEINIIKRNLIENNIDNRKAYSL